jgi:hypothetical protein
MTRRQNRQISCVSTAALLKSSEHRRCRAANRCPNPTPADALAITHSLRVEGNLEARRLVERIKKTVPCRYLKYRPTFFGCSPFTATLKASLGEAVGFTPERIINEIRRNARYTAADFRRIDSDPPVDPVATMTRLRELLSEAEAFVSRMPTNKAWVAIPERQPSGAARSRSRGGVSNPCREKSRPLARQSRNHRRHV